MKRVVIIGGGFAGLHLARKLNNREEFSVLLIDKVNHHQFQPLFYQVASARLEPANISFPFRKIFQKSRNVLFRMDEVLEVMPSEKKIRTATATIEFDHLVLATGCTTNFFGNERLGKYALKMKSTIEAIEIRNEVLASFETYISIPEERDSIRNFVIVGGGPTGVELAGAFAEMKRYILPRDYPRADFSSMKIIIVEGSTTTLGAMSAQAQEASMRYMRQLGVEVMTGVHVTDYDGEVLTFSDGKTMRSRNVIWTAGVKGNVVNGLPETVVNRNRYVVDRYNKVRGFEDIYAIGDIAYMETPKYPKGHPQLANVAINQGKNLGKNFIAMRTGGKLTEYEYRDLGSMATVGKHKAVVDLPWWKFHGYFAWFIWMSLHLMLILSTRNKLMIFLNWAWNYFTRDSSLRLIFSRRAVPKASQIN
jgi:NADH:ubiquinone reductase (H+-translocating)